MNDANLGFPKGVCSANSEANAGVRSITGQRAYEGFGLMDDANLRFAKGVCCANSKANASVRSYSPSLGRFIQPDTVIPDLGNSQAWNRYSYVNNSPIIYVDPSGHYMEQACGFSGGNCGTAGELPGNSDSGGGGGGGGSDQPGDIDEDVESEKETNQEVKEMQHGFPKCGGPICIAHENFYTLYFVPGDQLIPIIFQGINVNYGIGLQMNYVTDFSIQAIWFDIQIEEYIDALTSGEQEGAIFTSLIVDFESGDRDNYYLGTSSVNGNFVGTNTYEKQIPVTYRTYRDEITRLTIKISLVVWNNMGVVSAFGYEPHHYYSVPIIAGPNAQ